MKVSYNLLQTYFTNKLPEPKKVVELFERHLAEVEEMVEVEGDTMIDVNILPDRACYALSHEGIAFELSQLGDFGFSSKTVTPRESAGDLVVDIQDTDFCDRYVGVKVTGIDNTMSTPDVIKKTLETVGQRSINFLVDLSNFVMIDIGQPLHVFDADLMENHLIIRRALEGEKITTLDNRDITLTKDDLVVADTKNPLVIGGIKGGKIAEATLKTTNIILESAHFNATLVRKSSQRVGIKTDGSKRHENAFSPTFTPRGACLFLDLLIKYQPNVKVVSFIDKNTTSVSDKHLAITLDFISEKIGMQVTKEQCVSILQNIQITTEFSGDTLELTIPEYRKDLNTPEDIADEVGRIIGYDKLEPQIPSFVSKDECDPIFVVSNKIRNFLVEKGFSEVYTYSLAEKGEMEIANGLASDKSFMRSQLTSGIEEALTRNVYYADFLAQNKIQIFEIGTVFKKESEYNALAVGIAYKKVNKGQSAIEDIKILRDELFTLLSPKLQTVCSVDDTGGLLMCEGKQIGMINNKDGILEFNLDEVIKVLPSGEFAPLSYHAQNKYETLSSFPFTTRDVAVFVEGPATKHDEVLGLIKEKGTGLLVKTYLFDVFEKKNKETGEVEKTSYGARLVFQSFEKTLTDEEINPIMDVVYTEMKTKGWEVR